jgi:hypothetical protein
MNRRVATSVMLVAALAAGCKNNRSKLDDWPNGGQRELTKDSQSKGIDAPPPREPVTAAKLSPVIHELGPDNVVPTTIVIQLAAAVIDKADVGMTSDKTKIKITPETPGRLSFTGVSELTFQPAQPFKFNTEYKVELLAVESRDGVLEQPPADQWGDKWTHAFKTPAFTFLSWAPTDLDVP